MTQNCLSFIFTISGKYLSSCFSFTIVKCVCEPMCYELVLASTSANNRNLSPLSIVVDGQSGRGMRPGVGAETLFTASSARLPWGVVSAGPGLSRFGNREFDRGAIIAFVVLLLLASDVLSLCANRNSTSTSALWRKGKGERSFFSIVASSSVMTPFDSSHAKNSQ